MWIQEPFLPYIRVALLFEDHSDYVAVVVVMVMLVLVLVLVVLLLAGSFFSHMYRICSLRLQSTN